MSLSGSTLSGGLLRRLAAALVVVAASLAAGCDAEPEPSSSEPGAELGRSASELDQTDGEAGDDAADDDATHDEEAPPSEVELIGPPGGSSPLDPRAEPDPIPWVPRSADGSHDT